jgi:lipopolysaccharide biosynthesis glycosyltransferase
LQRFFGGLIGIIGWKIDMRTAVVVLCTGEYWRGAKVLFHTLRKYGQLPKTVECVALGMQECDFARAVSITQDLSWVPVNKKYFRKVADKFFALTLAYDRIVLMDADMMCVGDCSYLWSERIGQLPFYAVPDFGGAVYYCEKVQELELDVNQLVHAGTMVFQMNRLPRMFVRELLQGIVDDTIQSYDGGDQGYLNAYFQRIRPELEIGFLPQVYNVCLDKHTPKIAEEASRVVHFCGRNANPWEHRLHASDWRMPFVQSWRKEWEELSS